MCSWENFKTLANRKKIKTQWISFPESFLNIKRILFCRTSTGRLLLKLIYWNKSKTIKTVNSIITTNVYRPTTSSSQVIMVAYRLTKMGDLVEECLNQHLNILLFHVNFILSNKFVFDMEDSKLEEILEKVISNLRQAIC